MKIDSKIYVSGHRGLVGSAIIRKLNFDGYQNIVTRTHAELDLTDNTAVEAFFHAAKPEYVFHAAAKVGGIVANNNYPADFIYSNLSIQNNVIHQSWCAGVKRLLFLGSSCIYPRECPQPIKEEYLLTGPLEPTNRPYAVAKIAGIEMCWSYNRQYGTQYMAVMPTNLYGEGDNYNLETSHVIPALIRKMHEAKIQNAVEVVVWGTGKPMREFLSSNDMADACIELMTMQDSKMNKILLENSPPLINIGTGKDITIADLSKLIAEIVSFNGDIIFDENKPDGTPKKLLDVSKINEMGWNSTTKLKDGLTQAYKYFLASEIY